MSYIGDTYYYSLGQIKNLLERFWIYEPVDFDDAESRADIKIALEYYGFKERDCIKISPKKIAGVFCYRVKVSPKIVGYVAEYLNGNLWFLNKKSSSLENYLQADLDIERETVSV